MKRERDFSEWQKSKKLRKNKNSKNNNKKVETLPSKVKIENYHRVDEKAKVKSILKEQKNESNQQHKVNKVTKIFEN